MKKRGVAVDREFDIVECTRCGHHYVDPRIADESLGDLYDDTYFRAGGFDRESNYFAPRSAYTKRFACDVVDSVASTFERSIADARWLDYGCGPGHLLEALRDRSVSAVGYDDSPAALDICATRHLATVTREQLSRLEGTFDVVSAIEVIEHVGDPQAFLRSLVRLLRVGGIAYVQTGNWHAIRRVAGTPYIMPEGHIHYFTPPEMRRMFSSCGLQEVRVLNRSWFPFRDAPPQVRASVPIRAFDLAASATRRLIPSFAPNPIGRRTV